MRKAKILYRRNLKASRAGWRKAVAEAIDLIHSKGVSLEEIALELGYTVDSIISWRRKDRCPKLSTIKCLSASYPKILGKDWIDSLEGVRV